MQKSLNKFIKLYKRIGIPDPFQLSSFEKSHSSLDQRSNDLNI